MSSKLELTKAISEEHFIRVVYDFVWGYRSRFEAMSNEKKEEAARTALALHKDYWHRCEISEKIEGLGKNERL